MAKIKILVVHGESKDCHTIVEKVKKLNSKSGPFECIFFLGDVVQELNVTNIDGLPVVYTFSSTSEVESSKIKSNLISLNGYGVYQTSNDLRIAYIMNSATELNGCKDEVLAKFKEIDDTVDILITKEWSRCVAEREQRVTGSAILDDAITLLQPRYHFTGKEANTFFESPPFQWKETNTISRFLNLASYGKSGKKWAYALNLELDATLDTTAPTNAIENPYYVTKKRPQPDDSIQSYQNKTKKIGTVVPEACHFCFTNPKLQDHMIVSISDYAYITIAKGPLSVPKGEMNFSGHCLLIPIEHIAKFNVGQENLLQSGFAQDMINYEKSIVKMNFNKFEMSTVVFEINSDRSIHYHKQLLPIPKYLIMKFRTALDRQIHFNNEKLRQNVALNFQTYNSLSDFNYKSIMENAQNNYMQFTVYETAESDPTIYLATFKLEDRIDLQFGRRVLAFLLNLPRRVRWDSPVCSQTKEQEVKEVELFQKSYKEYEPSKSN
ncbi:hypothetical protein KAFR_0K01550 [Kazachstania africana CBS 2517]|uniref:Cwf19-like C-terminal domain-containing protein n=1 Tax=Kazachstania africana (strain ATCC 22294 / BCRC 22015 / CBS 2517 / CECT 1963 / NBRC 1671 / NRRL Y-8276) TaxID=1071382 RepID=H2B1K9_KAZAF|nr:hypothetical protein KAFR_0K01550 [Kazachstania africana CBS 2517]CCF60509.1 hypothetical protein KAFR_0K01550 [Kazachstania africana CBS 2517]